MALKTLKDIDVDSKTVLYRSPYDIGVNEKENGELVIKDDSRIKATLPTLEYLIRKKCKIVILTWVKRPGGKVVEKLRTDPHALALSKLLDQEVHKADDCIGDKVDEFIQNMSEGQILMLENTRFYPEDDAADEEFAKKLVKGKDLIVFDGFPQSHRIHASTTEILKLLPSVAGFYFEKEYNALNNLLEDPKRPFTLIIGGAKVSDKVGAINNLIDKVDHVLVGGGPANVFLKATGKEMADSFIEDVFVDKAKGEKKDWVELAKEILKKGGDKILVPVDLTVADSKDDPKRCGEVSLGEGVDFVPEGFMALDIGTETSEIYEKIIMDSKTVFWNGPPGMFEKEQFCKGTLFLCEAMKKCGGTTIVAGGDTIEAAKKYCDIEKITHISLAGGATLELLSGKRLPVLDFLEK